MILLNDRTLMKVDHPMPNSATGETPDMQMPFTAVPIKRLANIIAISACAGHFVALERCDTEPISKWAPERVC